MILRLLAGALALVLFSVVEAKADNGCGDDRYAWTCDLRHWNEHGRFEEPKRRVRKHEQRSSIVAHPAELHSGGVGPRPARWCGWYARQLVGQDPGPAFNVARNWARWGHAASPAIGVIVVWPHHVGMITGQAPNGEWIVKSGNDGHRVRERPLSVTRAIAFRAS